MAEKEIIIDGVDVSGCLYLKEYTNCQLTTHLIDNDAKYCKNFTNCYYKRLKRLKDAYKELKAEYKDKIREISNKLDFALDADRTDADESLELIYGLADELKEFLINV